MKYTFEAKPERASPGGDGIISNRHIDQARLPEWIQESKSKSKEKRKVTGEGQA